MFASSIKTSQNNDLFSNGNPAKDSQLESVEDLNDPSVGASYFRKSVDFDNSFKMLKDKGMRNKESSATLVKKFTEDNLNE
mmetsp:Transcript_19290/g.17111  ORF Transcript_19290/g.17111 Transcript_19290/m.17111 type:complete len:81 (+) Transcript_19290:190-432(+)